MAPWVVGLNREAHLLPSYKSELMQPGGPGSINKAAEVHLHTRAVFTAALGRGGPRALQRGHGKVEGL